MTFSRSGLTQMLEKDIRISTWPLISVFLSFIKLWHVELPLQFFFCNYFFFLMLLCISLILHCEKYIRDYSAVVVAAVVVVATAFVVGWPRLEYSVARPLPLSPRAAIDSSLRCIGSSNHCQIGRFWYSRVIIYQWSNREVRNPQK